MAWQYSDPLSGALLAASTNKSESDLGSSLYRQYYSGYDPLVSRYQARQNLYHKHPSLDIFDEIDDLTLEMEAESLFSSRNKQQLSNYVPTSILFNNNNVGYIDKATGTSFIEDDSTKAKQRAAAADLYKKASQIPKQPPPKSNNSNRTPKKNESHNQQAKNGHNEEKNNFKPKQQQSHSQNHQHQHQQPQQPHSHPHLFQNQSINHIDPNGNTNNNGNQYIPTQNVQPMPMAMFQPNFTPNHQHIQVQPHDSQHQRLLQFQNRMITQQQYQQPLQVQSSGPQLSELEMLKYKQQQERQQLLANTGPINHTNNHQQMNGFNPIQLNNNNNNNNNNFNNINNNNIPNNNLQNSQNSQNNNNNFFQQYHLKNKQMSETSIPSTNADPLNSNSPTPPLTHRKPKNFPKNNNNQKSNDKVKAHSQQDLNQKSNQFIQRSFDENPDGSYLHALKDSRIREQRLAKDKYTANDYKTYQKNYGFGRDFLPFETETKSEKLEKARKRDEYARMIKERNTHRNSDFFQGKYMDTLTLNSNRRGGNKVINDYELTSRRK